MSKEYLKSIIDTVSGIEVKSEAEQIAKYELIEWVEYLENNTLELLEEVKLKQTKKVFEALEQVIKTGSCSYRYLIYDMLGFSPKHYQDLISGLTITNAVVELEELRNRNKKAMEFLKEFHNYENRFKWCEEDYISTIEKLEEILKGGKE